jgi:hypothetical protein
VRRVLSAPVPTPSRDYGGALKLTLPNCHRQSRFAVPMVLSRRFDALPT